MSDVEEDVPLGTLTRFQRMREELEQEKEGRKDLEAKILQLEGELEQLRAPPITGNENGNAPPVGEDPVGNEAQEGEELPHEAPQQEASAHDLTSAEKLPLAVHPLSEKGLHSLTDMYQAMGASQRLQGVTLTKPKSFSGAELTHDPYSLTHWYREVSCWVQGYALNDTQQVVLALQTLSGTARIMMDNIIMSDKNRVSHLPALYELLKETFQRRDPGPDAWKEFQRTRMHPVKEDVVKFLNRLLLLSFVVNMSTDPTCMKISECDIATKLRIGLPYSMSNKIEQHFQLLVELGRSPDMSPWGVCAAALKVEADERERAKATARNNKLPGTPTVRSTPVATVRAMPNSDPTSRRAATTPAGRVAKRFADLSKELQERIVRVQTELKDLPLGATLSPDQQKQCTANSLCLRCRRYGHDAKQCRHSSPMSPKN